MPRVREQEIHVPEPENVTNDAGSKTRVRINGLMGAAAAQGAATAAPPEARLLDFLCTSNMNYVPVIVCAVGYAGVDRVDLRVAITHANRSTGLSAVFTHASGGPLPLAARSPYLSLQRTLCARR